MNLQTCILILLSVLCSCTFLYVNYQLFPRIQQRSNPFKYSSIIYHEDIPVTNALVRSTEIVGKDPVVPSKTGFLQGTSSLKYASNLFHEKKPVINTPTRPSEIVVKDLVVPSKISFSQRKMFSVIIVTHNEGLLEKTVRSVVNNTNPLYLLEVVVVDDVSRKPVQLSFNDSRIRIIRSEEHLGLIRARILGGNESKGDFLAFLDAHVRVAPDWLSEPYCLLQKHPHSLVNFLTFSMNPKTFEPLEAWNGFGSSTSMFVSLEQFWGGGSDNDIYSPITQGMFATTKEWWNQGQMDPGLAIWGGENVEISLRTWLCGGEILVAKSSYVAHDYRNRFPYPIDRNRVLKNYARVATVWFDQSHLSLFYRANNIKMKKGKVPFDIGNITDRLKLKKQLNCSSFFWYTKFFKHRAVCLPEKLRPKGYKPCGKNNTVSIIDLPKVKISNLFSKPSNFSWNSQCYFVCLPLFQMCFSFVILFEYYLFLTIIISYQFDLLFVRMK